MAAWLGRLIVSSAVRKVVYVMVGLGIAFVLGVLDVRAATDGGPAPVPPALAVPCDGPDDPPGCDPLETPTPTPTPSPTPEPSPSPTPEPTPVTVHLAAADRDRLDLITYAIVTLGGLVVVSSTAAAIATSLRR